MSPATFFHPLTLWDNVVFKWNDINLGHSAILLEVYDAIN